VKTGAEINDMVLSAGVVAIYHPDDTRSMFYPRSRLPAHLTAYLTSSDRARAKALAVFLARDLLPNWRDPFD